MFLAGGCATVPETIMDIRDIKQDHISHIDKHISDRALISDDDQKRMDNNFNSRYFAPWRREKPCYQREIVERGFEKYKNNSGYGENGRKHSESRAGLA